MNFRVSCVAQKRVTGTEGVMGEMEPAALV